MCSLQTSKGREIGLKPLQQIHEANAPDDVKEKPALSIDELTAEIAALKQQKQQLMEQTKRNIENEKKAWETEKQTYIEAANKEGYEAGFKSGQASGLQTYQDLIDQANDIVQQTEIDYHKKLERSKEAIVELAVKSAEKIIQDTLEETPELFNNIVEKALKEFKDTGRVTMYLHPDNYKHVIEQKDELTELLGKTKNLSIYTNNTLGKNSCMIEHPYGQIDANVDTQFEQIRLVLLEVASGG